MVGRILQRLAQGRCPGGLHRLIGIGADLDEPLAGAAVPVEPCFARLAYLQLQPIAKVDLAVFSLPPGGLGVAFA